MNKTAVISILGAGATVYLLYRMFFKQTNESNSSSNSTNMNEKIPRGYRNNNPTNIRKNEFTYPGEIVPSTDKSFKQFKSREYGYRAALALLKNSYIPKGYNTITKIITRWAPAKDNNNTAAYISDVCQLTGLTPGEVISSKEQLIKIVYAMAICENGSSTLPDLAEIEAGWNLL